MPECKYCGTELEYHDTIDQYGDEEECVVKESGHCPKCDKMYTWSSIYKFSHFENLEEV